MAKSNVKSLLTPEFRVSFPYVFKPQKPLSPGGKEKYTITMLFPKGEELKAMKAAAQAVLVEKYGEDQAKWPKGIRSPFKDQGDKEYEGYEAGAICITANSDQRPGLVDQNVQDIIEERQFYPGCYARAEVRPFVYETKGDNGGILNRGVSFGLQNIQKLREGDPLGGRSRPTDVFEAVAEGDTNGGSDAAKTVFG